MSTLIRPEVTRKSKYWISKHRGYELKHFCLQYPEFVEHYNALDGYYQKIISMTLPNRECSKDKVENCAIKRALYSSKIKLIDDAAKETDPVLGVYILLGVTRGLSYTTLKNKHNIPCGRDVYYSLYHKFFWILSESINQLYS